jgi:uncharacterized membrane protein YeaQ/YmgE (transglycosylase-associated protein family)
MKKIFLFTFILFVYNLSYTFAIVGIKDTTLNNTILKKEIVQKNKTTFGFSFLEAEQNTGAIASFILGIVGLPFSLRPLIGLTIGIITIILGTKALQIAKKIQNEEKNWAAIVGITLGSVIVLISSAVGAYWLLIHL